MEPPTPEETLLLSQFRSKLADLKLTGEENGDFFLLRWLRARDLHIGKAEEMLRKSIEWRRDNEIDSVRNWEPPENISKNYPFEVIGFDKGGSPICLMPFGHWDVKKLVADYGKSIYVKYNDLLHERVMSIMSEKRQEGKKEIWQFITIFDLDGFSLRQMAAMGTVDAILETVRRFEANYPETLLKAYCINAPRAFTFLWALIKPLLTARTMSKVEIHGTNPAKWKKALLARCPADQLLPKYGGTNMAFKNVFGSENNGKCDSPDLGDPELDDTMVSVNIDAGEKLEIAYDIKNPDTLINYTFKTQDFDVGFSVMFDGREEIIPYNRVESHQEAQAGSFNCSKPGRYTLVFDNSYSRLRAKTIYYMVTIESNTEEDEDEITAL